MSFKKWRKESVCIKDLLLKLFEEVSEIANEVTDASTKATKISRKKVNSEIAQARFLLDEIERRVNK